MEKFKILWLDDEHDNDPNNANLIPLDLIDPDLRSNFDFETEKYKNECLEILKNRSNEFDAVIFDANGKNSTDPPLDKPNKVGFFTLIAKAKEKDLLSYVFSGKLAVETEADAEMTLEHLNLDGFSLGENLFLKSEGPEKMLEKIKKDLEQAYSLYTGGFEYLLDFFKNSWIEPKFKTEFLDPLMQLYRSRDSKSAHGNHMRNLTEQMLKRINIEYSLSKKKEKDPSFYEDIANKIKYDEELNDSRAMPGLLLHMVNLSNYKSHDATDDLLELFFISDFSTFFIITRWFHHKMKTLAAAGVQNKKSTSVEKNSTPKTGISVPVESEGKYSYCTIKARIRIEEKNCKSLEITGAKVNIDNYTGEPFFQAVYINPE